MALLGKELFRHSLAHAGSLLEDRHLLGQICCEALGEPPQNLGRTRRRSAHVCEERIASLKGEAPLAIL